MSKKIFLVSGAGSGIGRAIAIDLAQVHGTEVVLLGRREDALCETRAMLPRPASHRVVAADLRDPSSVRRALSDIPRLEGVVANAGVGGENHYGPDDRWHEILSTNLTGTYTLVNEALPALRRGESEFKNIVVVSSILARLGVPKYSAYCASKAGLLGLTRSWASEWARDRILVNAICPGWVDTEMSARGLEEMAKNSGRALATVRAEQRAHVPLGKMSTPQEIAALVIFLLSKNQMSITGQTIDINNGALMP